MLCDSRDVVVQSDAFDKVDYISFVTGAEEKRIGECFLNQTWIYNCYGKDVLRMLSDETIVCSGVSLGSREIVLEYLHSVIQEVKRLGAVAAGSATIDQCVHNYLIRTNALNFPVHLTKTIDGIIGTLHHYDRKKIVVDGADNISVENDIAPSIIHQYTRFPELCEHVVRIYA
jgi:hypothetical protein